MTTQLLGKNCDGGHYTCSPPKDCCKQGCCFSTYYNNNVPRPPVIPPVNFFTPHFFGLWYFWVAVMATVAALLCVCSLWRRYNDGSFCCKDPNREERATEPDSNGSFYAPPQYSRCNSFYQPPPPYSEVTSKPDLYPLVFSCNRDSIIKSNNNSTGYFMVQYFRNFIVRPVGALSTTSTVDSLSSSFICNAANEANIIIPPSYSCMGSLEEVITNEENVHYSEESRLSHSVSLQSSTDFHQPTCTSPSIQSRLNSSNTPSTLTTSSHNNSQISIRDNPCFEQSATNIVNKNVEETAMLPINVDELVRDKVESKSQNNCDASPHKWVRLQMQNHKLPKEYSQDSSSQDDDNFLDLLNLSVCVPSSVVNLGTSLHLNNYFQELQYSVTNSMTGSDISSLANLGSPDSPPRATSPTLEMKVLLDKIHQLPQQKSPLAREAKPKGRNKAKTLYMPLIDVSKTKSTKMFAKSWLSRSAPNTPCSNFVPNFSGNRKGSSQRNSKIAVGDHSPLLKEHEEFDEDAKDQSL